MKVLVTGAGGFIGRYVVGELLRRGHEVTAVIRPSTDRPLLANERLAILRADLRRPPGHLARAVGSSDAVLHLAATLSGGWRDMFDGTVLATRNLLDAMDESGWEGRFVHVSTFSVYGLNQVPPGSLVDESTPLEPQPHRRDEYAWTKFLQERLVRERRAGRGPGLVVVRPGVVYGREQPFVHSLGRRVGSALVMLGTRNPVPLNYVENLASLLAVCAEHPRAAGETFNAVDPAPLRQWSYASRWLRAQPDLVVPLPLPRAVIRAAGVSLAAAASVSGGRVAPPRFLDPYAATPNLRRFRYGSARARHVLGWTPPVALEESLRRTFDGAGDTSA